MKQIGIIILMMFLILSCDDEEAQGPPNGGENEVKLGINIQDTIWVDKRATLDSLNRIKITLYLPSKKYASVIWSYIDPDDPADDVNNVDPNGPEGNDNGYLGTGEEYLPAKKSKFYEGNIEDTVTTIDENGYSEIYFEVSPDTYGWWHPGDNFIIRAKVEDTILESQIIYAWKRIKVEFDCMVSGKISNYQFYLARGPFQGECFSGFSNINEKPYMFFNPYDTTYLIRDDTTLANDTIETPEEFRDFIQTHRDWLTYGSDYRYPVYLIGGTTDNDSFGINWYGHTHWDIDTQNLIYISRGSIVFVKKIEEDYPLDVDETVAVSVAHEFGHFIGKISHDDPHTRLDCIMASPSPSWCPGQRFCTFCIYMLRGNIYRLGEPVFKNKNKITWRKK